MKSVSKNISNKFRGKFELPMFNRLTYEVLFEQLESGNWFLNRMRVKPRWLFFTYDNKPSISGFSWKSISWEDMEEINEPNVRVKEELLTKKHLI